MARAYLRLFAWVATASITAAFVAPGFPALLSQAVDVAFGTVLPVIPFAVLLTVLFVLRWGDLRDVLKREGSASSQLPTRFAGAAMLVALLLLRGITDLSVYSSGVAIVLAFYGTALIINPLTRRITLPYAAIYSAGVAAPALMQLAFGEPLATLSSLLSARMIALSGISLTWQGTQFAFVSKSGGLVAATVTPGCSSIVSVTTFLGLLGLMHIDLKKDLPSTIKLAAAGVAVLTLLNAARITILVWVGYADGPTALWNAHNWVGYALFLGFYLATLAIYPRMGPRSAPGRSTVGSSPPPLLG